MARVDMARRAEIGAERRARTRTAILEAARECYAAMPSEAVTVDALMQAAGLAKGTFYVHFPDLAALETEIGAGLIHNMDERLQPARLAVADPLTRVATAATILLRDLAAVPARARLAARAAQIPPVVEAVLSRLQEDLASAEAAGRVALPADLAARLITAIFVQAATDLGQGRIDATAVPDIVRTILRAAGCAPKDAAARERAAARHADTFTRQTEA